MFLPGSANQFVNVLLCAEARWCSGSGRDTSGEECVDVWSAVWAAVDAQTARPREG